MAKVSVPGSGTVSGVIGTIGPNQDLVFSSISVAIRQTAESIESAIAAQNHSVAGSLPDLTIHFRNGSTAIMPASVYVRDGEALTFAARSSIVREWIEKNTPEELKGGRVYIAVYAHHSQIWKYK